MGIQISIHLGCWHCREIYSLHHNTRSQGFPVMISQISSCVSFHVKQFPKWDIYRREWCIGGVTVWPGFLGCFLTVVQAISLILLGGGTKLEAWTISWSLQLTQHCSGNIPPRISGLKHQTPRPTKGNLPHSACKSTGFTNYSNRKLIKFFDISS